MKLGTVINQKARGRLRCEIVENGVVVKKFPWQKNLILNQGLNNVCSSNSWAALTAYCAVGTGVTNTNNGTLPGDTGSGASTTFTGPAAFDFTTLSSVGDMIQMTTGASSGTEVRITAVTDATHVEYTPSGTINAGEFIVYRTSQVGLATEVKRNNGWNNAAGYMGNTIVGNTVAMLRTYEFSAEAGPITYTEAGISDASGAGNNLFSRIKLVTPVSLLTGQQLRVSYELTITMEPDTLTAKTFNITGWPVAPSVTTDGDEQWQMYGINGVSINGNVTSLGGATAMEVSSSTGQIFLSTVSTAPAAFGSSAAYGAGTVITPKSFSLLAYTPLSFLRDKTVTFAVLEANSTSIRSMGICGGANASAANFACVFDEAQTKDNLHTLTLNFRFTVGRVLS